MKIEVCKTCPHCVVFPRPGDRFGDPKRKHYHCDLARPQAAAVRGGTAHGFTAACPTPIIAEEFLERVRPPHNETAKAVEQTTLALKAEFIIPTTCPKRNEH